MRSATSQCASWRSPRRSESPPVWGGGWPQGAGRQLRRHDGVQPRADESGQHRFSDHVGRHRVDAVARRRHPVVPTTGARIAGRVRHRCVRCALVPNRRHRNHFGAPVRRGSDARTECNPDSGGLADLWVVTRSRRPPPVVSSGSVCGSGRTGGAGTTRPGAGRIDDLHRGGRRPLRHRVGRRFAEPVPDGGCLAQVGGGGTRRPDGPQCGPDRPAPRNTRSGHGCARAVCALRGGGSRSAVLLCVWGRGAAASRSSRRFRRENPPARELSPT